MALGDGVHVDELWFVRKDGSRLFVTEALGRIDDEGGNLRGFAMVARDITKRKSLEDELRQARDQLETLVQERTARLRETIRELESFSYSVSHDLRAPLRAMQGLADLLHVEFGECLGPKGRDLVARIVAAGKRMDLLIEDVLKLSHLGREPIRLQALDLEKILRKVIAEMPQVQESLAEISVAQPLHKVLGHESLLSQCASNLLGNAVKFVAPGVRPQVNIWTEAFNDRVRVWIKDNGVGIPKGKQDRIFGLFQRLHHDDAYPGTGIGLAIVRKAIERMNGKVGVESEPGQGSRFWLELAAGPG
jgi:signal transduction histidine kinase